MPNSFAKFSPLIVILLTPAAACAGTTPVIFGVDGAVNDFSHIGSAISALHPLISKNKSKNITETIINISIVR